MIKTILLIGIGSFAGGVLRYLVSYFVQNHTEMPFTLGTFIVNVLGCFILGLIYGLAEQGCSIDKDLKSFLCVGFCGGVTTFSTFINENFLLLRGSHVLPMLAYSLASLIVGFAMLYAGYAASRLASLS